MLHEEMVENPETGEMEEAYQDSPEEYGWQDADSNGVVRYRHKIVDGRVCEFRFREGLRTSKALSDAMECREADGRVVRRVVKRPLIPPAQPAQYSQRQGHAENQHGPALRCHGVSPGCEGRTDYLLRP